MMRLGKDGTICPGMILWKYKRIRIEPEIFIINPLHGSATSHIL